MHMGSDVKCRLNLDPETYPVASVGLIMDQTDSQP